ncbi:AAA family ATPase [Micromonospora sp. SH-82]|uniref:AAA family ATPase n=1 Tax=Micromonospora sp. SH-82 TaxID=3132938 RepID=UPI003EC0A830
MFVRGISLPPGTPTPAERARWPYTVPAVSGLAEDDIEFTTPVTLLAGDNGSGKSTLVEAVAVAVGFNPEGGSTSFRFATRATESPLGEHLVLRRTPGRRPRTGFFLRAESYYNVATEIERLDADPDSPSLLGAYGGISPHHRSHGESFLDLVNHRFGPQGLYLLDEPEAALSVHGCLALLLRIAELVDQGSQFIIATHSPILLASPGATILHIDTDGTIAPVDYDQAEPVTLTRAFLADPGRFLHHLLTER